MAPIPVTLSDLGDHFSCLKPFQHPSLDIINHDMLTCELKSVCGL